MLGSQLEDVVLPRHHAAQQRKDHAPNGRSLAEPRVRIDGPIAVVLPLHGLVVRRRLRPARSSCERGPNRDAEQDADEGYGGNDRELNGSERRFMSGRAAERG